MKIELDLPRESYYLPVLEKIFPLDNSPRPEAVFVSDKNEKENEENKTEDELLGEENTPEQEMKEEEKKEEKSIDKNVVKDLFVELARKKKHALAKEILESYGVNKVSNLIDALDYDSYVAVCERCREVLNDA